MIWSVDLPRSFTIRESSHRIHNPFSGMMLIGEPYWRREPPDQATVDGCHATAGTSGSRCLS